MTEQQRARTAKGSWKTHFELPVGMSLSARRQVEVMTAKLGSPPERGLSFWCERYADECDFVNLRGESIQASSEELFRAVKEFTRRSEIVNVQADQHITVRLRYTGLWFGFGLRERIVTYLIVPRASSSCRILAKQLVRQRTGWRWRVLKLMLASLSSQILRRELLQLRRIAERSGV